MGRPFRPLRPRAGRRSRPSLAQTRPMHPQDRPSIKANRTLYYS